MYDEKYGLSRRELNRLFRCDIVEIEHNLVDLLREGDIGYDDAVGILSEYCSLNGQDEFCAIESLRFYLDMA